MIAVIMLGVNAALADESASGESLQLIDHHQLTYEEPVFHEPTFNAVANEVMVPSSDVPATCVPQDRIWMISTRHLTNEPRCANLESPNLKLSQLGSTNRFIDASWEQYCQSIQRSRRVVVYVHGNRIQSDEIAQRGLLVHRNITKHRVNQSAVDWVIWSWPSSKQGILVRDARRKAEKTDTQGLYLSWLLGQHAKNSIPTTLIGYSFGGRVITGALHALAGGTLGGRKYPGGEFQGMNYNAGLVAPAVQSNWMSSGGYHGLSTKNLDHLVLFYNRRDAVLKRYWLIDRVRGAMALGYSGPSTFAPRFDGSKLPVRSRDCSPSVGRYHREVAYYTNSCRAGAEMAGLIHDTLFAK
jgi:hypothetical protein